MKYHFKTDQGIRNLPAAEADKMQATSPDHAIKDLYNAIADGDPPSWTVYVQVYVVQALPSFFFFFRTPVYVISFVIILL